MKIIFHLFILVLFSISAISCKQKKQEVEKTKITLKKKVSKGSTIINNAIKAHGGKLYDNASFKFTFRNKEYTFTNNINSYKYSVKKQTADKKELLDILNNDVFSRTINGETINLNKNDASKYSEALNSVIYFATLPYKLKDVSVNKKFINTITIKQNEYHVIKITFNQEGGGKDFDDEYYYWINSTTNTMDYFAYNYQVNNGGVRFRSSYNRRIVDGIIFQNYINYKAPVGTPLDKLPGLFEKGELEEISRVETENINNINTCKTNH